MGSIRLTLCTGLLTAVALSPTAALAADGGGVSVPPSGPLAPVQGADVALWTDAFAAYGDLTGQATEQTNQTAQTNQSNQADQSNKSNQPNKSNQSNPTDQQSDHDKGDDDSGRQSDHGDKQEQQSGRGDSSDHDQQSSGHGTSDEAADDQGDKSDQQSSGGRQPGTGPSDAPSKPSGAASPTAPVPAGGGGTAHLASEDAARSAGPGTAQTVTGLLLAGLAAVAVGLRTARRGRGSA
ncbi:hypothetical protein [Streptomyces sp. V3I7]|uniref:hypothetical protein n=1 Tax=Streptomyces sp. V3I7 TaxID=3042278 RepID=UPI002783EA70|nr:hypothetical protein [Streptomyces sp. V3I7]MDQ0991092.1 hypothetical protein [Streptomyces sp. V3I7]